jgi:hypothetical protein
MGVGQTGRIIERGFKRAIYEQVRLYEIAQYRKSKRNFKTFLCALVLCSQCKRGMKKTTADIQIENKRENAPICIACIMGIKRKPKAQAVAEVRGKYSKKTYKQLLKVKKQYKKI